jgi:hypothetical protein
MDAVTENRKMIGLEGLKTPPRSRFGKLGGMAATVAAAASMILTSGTSCVAQVATPSARAREDASPRQKPAALTDLSRDGRELKAAFNADQGAAKILLIVSPTCPMCRSGAQVIEDSVLAQLGGDRPKVYVVWTKKLFGDNRDAASNAASLVPDRRARHFWDPTGYLGKQYGKTLELPGGRRFAWDVYLIFDPKVSWTDAPPVPAFWMHQLGGQKPELRLDGARFREAVVQRLN